MNGAIYSLAAPLVRPDAIASPRTDRSAIVLLAKRLDPPIVARIGDSIGFDGVRFVHEWRALEDNTPHTIMRDPAGKALGALVWTDDSPGFQVVKQTAPALAICCLLLALTAMLGLRRGRSIARELTDSEVRALLLAYRDKLTGLPNRAGLEVGFEDIMKHADRCSIPLHVGCVDIGRFKAVNDSHGHATGDELLRKAAQRIEACCEGNYRLGRFGGDEFVLLCDGHTREEVELTAQAVIDTMRQPFEISGTRSFVGCSVGILSLEPGERLDAQEALRPADLAMYHAKNHGGDRYSFYGPALDEVVRARADAHDRLRTALQDETLEVFYQPQCDAQGTVLFVEALVRWPQASLPGVPTAEFIRLAEQTGLTGLACTSSAASSPMRASGPACPWRSTSPRSSSRPMAP